MFGKKYTDDAIRRAAEKIIYYDNDQFFLFRVFRPTLGYGQNILGKTILGKEFRENADNKVQFGMGVCLKIAEYYLDGEAKWSEKFYKDVIYKAFNKGFLENYGKSMYKTFCKSRQTSSKFFVAGELWAGKYFVPKVIIEGMSNDNLEALEKYQNHLKKPQFFDLEVALEVEKLAIKSGIGQQKHQEFVITEIEKLETIFKSLPNERLTEFLKSLYHTKEILDI